MNTYQRHSYRKVRNSQTNSGLFAILVLALIVVIALIFAFSPVGDTIRTVMVEPLMERIASIRKRQEPIQETMAQMTAEPSMEPTPTPVHTETMTIAPKTFYILQMGQYTEESEAILVAAQNQSMGGGGYVYEDDGIYRLFAAAYTDANSLTSVQQQIRRDGYVNESYITKANTVHITFEGAPEAITIFQNAIDTMETCPIKLSNLSIAYDKGEVQAAEIVEKLQETLRDIDEHLEDLEKIDSEDIILIKGTLKNYRESISTFLLEHDSIHRDRYAGALRYLQLSLIDQYLHFFEG